MKRKIVIVLMVLVCFLLQSTVFQSLSIASISPNLLIILTSAYGFMKGKKEGMAVGFFCGLLEDIFFGGFWECTPSCIPILAMPMDISIRYFTVKISNCLLR